MTLSVKDQEIIKEASTEPSLLSQLVEKCLDETIPQPQDSFPEMVKAARQKAGLSQRAFAEKLGITQTQLCRLETTNVKPARKTLRRLSPYLGIPYATLLVKAGYSDVISEDEDYFTTIGQPVELNRIVEEIYRADADLALDLQNFTEYATQENICLLKLIISIMKKAVQEPNSYYTNLLSYTREYITNVLSLV